MSLFLSLQNVNGYDEVNEQKIEMARIQLDAMNTTFNTLLLKCRSKCIPHEYGESDLNKGESTCIDRCVLKFMQLNLIMGKNAQLLNFQPLNLHLYDRYTK